MSSCVSLYFASDLEALDWPERYEDSLVKKLFLPMMKEGATTYVKNGSSELALIKVGDKIVPFTINDTEYSNSYVTSIYSYLTYAEEEINRHNMQALKFIMKPALKILGQWFKKALINRTVIVNNFLLSTNLYDPLSDNEIEQIHNFLLKKFPSHTLIFRSLNNRTEKSLMKKVKKLSYQMITSRSIYFFDPNTPIPSKNRWINTSDNKLFSQKGISVMEHKDFRETDIPRIKELYNFLYLEKYTHLNPQFSEKFFHNAIKSKSFTLYGIKYMGKLVAVVGYFIQNGVITTPIVGYDISLPKSLGLYRMLMSIVIERSLTLKHLYHMSSGVGFFKRQRGATQEIESMGVYINHLTWFRRAPWKLFQYIFNGIARPLIIKYKL